MRLQLANHFLFFIFPQLSGGRGKKAVVVQQVKLVTLPFVVSDDFSAYFQLKPKFFHLLMVARLAHKTGAGIANNFFKMVLRNLWRPSGYDHTANEQYLP